MKRVSVRWGKLALVLAAVAISAAIAAPAAAYGKTATRIVVTKTKYTCDYSTPGVIPTAPVVTAKLQKKTSSGWVSLKGTIKVYMIDSDHDTYQWLFTKTSTASVKQTLGTRGKYKFAYAGSSTMKPCAGYSTRVDTIGETVERVDYSVSEVDATWTAVSVAYAVNWNTEAFPLFNNDGPVYLGYTGTLENTTDNLYSGDFDFYQEIWDPQTIIVHYYVMTDYIPNSSSLDTTARLLTDDPYLSLTGTPVTNSDPYTPAP